jgi:hypothetical protein
VVLRGTILSSCTYRVARRRFRRGDVPFHQVRSIDFSLFLCNSRGRWCQNIIWKSAKDASFMLTLNRCASTGCLQPHPGNKPPPKGPCATPMISVNSATLEKPHAVLQEGGGLLESVLRLACPSAPGTPPPFSPVRRTLRKRCPSRAPFCCMRTASRRGDYMDVSYVSLAKVGRRRSSCGERCVHAITHVPRAHRTRCSH